MIKKQPLYKLLDVFLLAAFALISLQRGVLLDNDSPSYINSYPYRSLMYPFIIDIYQFVVGVIGGTSVIEGTSMYQWNHLEELDDLKEKLKKEFIGMAVIQLTVGMASIIYVARKLRRYLEFNTAIYALVIAIFLIPYVIGFGNIIMTEAWAYPVFLVSMVLLIEALIHKKLRHFVYFFIAISILIMIRRQFLFVYPVIFVLLTYISIFLKDKFSNKALIFVLFITSIIATNLIERTYSYVKFGHFETTPFGGFNLITPHFYLSHASDAEIFDDELEHNLFEQTHAILRKTYSLSYNPDNENASGYVDFENSTLFTPAEKEAILKRIEDFTGEGWPENPPDLLQHYKTSYSIITWRALRKVADAYGIDDWYEFDRIVTGMAIKMMLNRPKEAALFWLKIFTHNYGGYLITLLYLVGVFYCIWCNIKHKDNLSLVALAIFMMDWANIGLVSLVEPVLLRYSMYTDAFTYIIMVVILVKFSEHRKKYLLEKKLAE